MRLTIFDGLSKLVSDRKISDLIDAGGICGKLLLLRPLIYMIFSRRRELDQYATVDASALVFIIYSVVCMYFAITEFKKYSICKKMLFDSCLFFFLLYSLYGLVTMIWSVNIELTGYRSFECISLMLLIIVVIGRLLSFNDLKLVIDWSMMFVFCESIISIIRHLQWTTNLLEVLGCNQQFVPLFFYLALFRGHYRVVDYLVFVLSIFSLSTVAYIGMALGLMSTIRGGTKMKIFSVLLFCTIGFAAFYIGPQKFLKDTLFFDKESISIEETSGRDYIMEAAIECADEYPMGLGFFAAEPFWLYKRVSGAINGHNSYFSAMMGCGYVGLVLIVTFIIVAYFNVRSRYIEKNYRAALFGSYCIVFVECLGNPSIGSRVYGAWTAEMYLICLIVGFYCYGKYGYANPNSLTNNVNYYENYIRR